MIEHDKEFEFTEIHLEMLRSMLISWDDCEAGAPTVEPTMPYGALDTMSRLAHFSGKDSVSLSEEEEIELKKLHRQCENAFQIFLGNGKLEAGVYDFEDHLAIRRSLLSDFTSDIRGDGPDFDLFDNLSSNKVIRFFQLVKKIWALRSEQRKRIASLDKPSPVSSFEVTDQHLLLLPNLSVRWNEPEVVPLVKEGEILDEIDQTENSWPVVGIDPKRPYGSMTYYFLDMGEILGIEPRETESIGEGVDEEPEAEFSEEQEDMLQNLHEDMQTVLQIFLQKASLPTGKYHNTSDGWVKAE